MPRALGAPFQRTMFDFIIPVITVSLTRVFFGYLQQRRARKLGGGSAGAPRTPSGGAANDEPHDPGADPGTSQQYRRDDDTLATHYAVLGLQPDASIDETKAAHRRLAFEFHPDRLPPDISEAVRDLVEARMQAINAARDALIAHAERKGS